MFGRNQVCHHGLHLLDPPVPGYPVCRSSGSPGRPPQSRPAYPGRLRQGRPRENPTTPRYSAALTHCSVQKSRPQLRWCGQQTASKSVNLPWTTTLGDYPGRRRRIQRQARVVLAAAMCAGRNPDAVVASQRIGCQNPSSRFCMGTCDIWGAQVRPTCARRPRPQNEGRGYMKGSRLKRQLRRVQLVKLQG